MQISQPRILILDDDLLMLESLKMALENKGYSLVHTAENVAQARHNFRQHKVDILISDINLACNENGINLVKELREHFDFSLIFISGSHYSVFEETLPLFPDANLIKPFSDQQVITSVRQVWSNKHRQSEVTDFELSDREREILGMFCKGKSTREVSEILSISLHTVQFHRKNLFKKMDVHSIQELINKARG